MDAGEIAKEEARVARVIAVVNRYLRALIGSDLAEKDAAGREWEALDEHERKPGPPAPR